MFFREYCEEDVFAYEILGAAYYANGDFTLGSQYYDQAVERSSDSEMMEFFRLRKKDLQELYESQ